MQFLSKAFSGFRRSTALLLAAVLIFGMIPAVYADQNAVPVVYDAPFKDLCALEGASTGTLEASDTSVASVDYAANGERGNGAAYTVTNAGGWWGQEVRSTFAQAVDLSAAKELWLYVDFSAATTTTPQIRANACDSGTYHAYIGSRTIDYIWAADRTIGQATAGAYGDITLPAQFKGWVRFPNVTLGNNVAKVIFSVYANNGDVVIVDSFCTLDADWVPATHGLPSERSVAATVENAPFVEVLNFNQRPLGAVSGAYGYDEANDGYWTVSIVENGEDGRAVQWETVKMDGGYYGQQSNQNLFGSMDLKDWTGVKELWFYVDLSQATATNPWLRIQTNSGVLNSQNGAVGVSYVSVSDRIYHYINVSEWGNIDLPAKFVGWLRVPMSSFTLGGDYNVADRNSIGFTFYLNVGDKAVVDSVCALYADWAPATHGLPSDRDVSVVTVPEIEETPFKEVLNFNEWPVGTVGNNDSYGKPQAEGYWTLSAVEGGEKGNGIQWTSTVVDGFWGQIQELNLVAPMNISEAREIWAYVDVSKSTRVDSVLRLNVGDGTNNTQLTPGAAVTYIAEDDRIVHDRAVGPYGEIFLPAGFVGWVRVPVTSITDYSVNFSAVTRVNISFTLNQDNTAILDSVCVLNEDWDPDTHGLPSERKLPYAVPVADEAPFEEILNFNKLPLGEVANDDAYGKPQDTGYWTITAVADGENGKAIQWTATKVDNNFWGQAQDLYLSNYDASAVKEIWAYVDLTGNTRETPVLRLNIGSAEGWTSLKKNMPITYIAEEDRMAHDTVVGEWGEFFLPTNFVGWVRIPVTSFEVGGTELDMAALNRVSVSFTLNEGDTAILDSVCVLNEDWNPDAHGLPSERELPPTVPVVNDAPFDEILNFDRWPVGAIGNGDIYGNPQHEGYWQLSAVEDGENAHALQWKFTKADGFWGQAHDLYLPTAADLSEVKELWAYVDISDNTRAEAVLRLSIGSGGEGWTGLEKGKPVSYVALDDRVINNAVVGEYGEFFLPSTFVGWVRIPMTSLKAEGEMEYSAITRVILSFTLNEGDTAIIDTICGLKADWVPATHGLPAERAICEHNYGSVVTDPEIGKEGYTTHTCTKCGDSYVDTFTDALEAPKAPVVKDSPFKDILTFNKLPLGTVGNNDSYGAPQANGFWTLKAVEKGEDGHAIEWTSTKVDGFWGQAHDLYLGSTVNMSAAKEIWAYVDLSGSTSTNPVLRLSVGSGGEGWTGLDKNKPVSYVSASDRTITDAKVGEWGEIFLPAKFVGWVRIPVASLKAEGKMDFAAVTRVILSFTLNQGDKALLDSVCVLNTDWVPATHGLPAERVPVAEDMNPNTGDQGILFASLLALSALAMGAVLVLKKKEQF